MQKDKLHESLMHLKCFQVPVVFVKFGEPTLRFIPFVNKPGISKKLKAVERRRGFYVWGKNPWTGKVNLEFR